MRSFILALFITSCITSTHAQFKLGVLAGAELSRMLLVYQNYRDKNEFKPMFTAGANGDVRIVDHLHAQFGLRYSRVNVIVIGNQYVHFNRAYCHGLQLPASILYTFGRKGGNQWGIGAGVYGTWHISGRKFVSLSNEAARLEIGNNFTSVTSDDITPFDFGVTGTLSYELKNGLYFNARYQRGLSNVFPMSSYLSLKVESISVNAGYYLWHSKKRSKDAPVQKS